MRHIGKGTVPDSTRTYWKVEKTTCDLCGDTLSAKATPTFDFDVCMKCYNEKLVSWFKSQGVTPNQERFVC